MYLYVVNGFRGHAIQRVLYVPSVKDDLKIQLYLFITIEMAIPLTSKHIMILWSRTLKFPGVTLALSSKSQI